MGFHRYYIPGQVVFITQTVNSRQPVFQNSEMIFLLKEIFQNDKEIHPFNMLAYVFLPDHFHVLFQPSGKCNFSQIMHSIKRNFTVAYKRSTNFQGNLQFWQKRFWDHVIRNEKDLENHLHYIHYNPIKHGYVKEMQDWKESSFLEWYELGAYAGEEKWVEPLDGTWGE
jgi:putative transposase